MLLACIKHINIKYHFVRETAAGIIKLKHVPTGQMTADIFTKTLPRMDHLKCLEELEMWITDNEEHPRASFSRLKDKEIICTKNKIYDSCN